MSGLEGYWLWVGGCVNDIQSGFMSYEFSGRAWGCGWVYECSLHAISFVYSFVHDDMYLGGKSKHHTEEYS